MEYIVVQVPTAKGIVYGFEAKILSKHLSKEYAEEAAFLIWVDEPAPDKRDYYSIEVVEKG